MLSETSASQHLREQEEDAHIQCTTHLIFQIYLYIFKYCMFLIVIYIFSYLLLLCVSQFQDLLMCPLLPSSIWSHTYIIMFHYFLKFQYIIGPNSRICRFVNIKLIAIKSQKKECVGVCVHVDLCVYRAGLSSSPSAYTCT